MRKSNCSDSPLWPIALCLPMKNHKNSFVDVQNKPQLMRHEKNEMKDKPYKSDAKSRKMSHLFRAIFTRVSHLHVFGFSYYFRQGWMHESEYYSLKKSPDITTSLPFPMTFYESNTFFWHPFCQQMSQFSAWNARRWQIFQTRSSGLNCRLRGDEIREVT